jgi:Kef-type K+ transport system membrane component KefB
VLFSARATGVVAPLTLLAAFLCFVAAVGAIIAGVERTGWLTRTLLALQETTAEIRVRGTVALLLLFATLATRFGLEAILGAFLAGATLKLLDRDQAATHTLLRVKLRAIGFGVFVPFFFVSTGMTLDIRSLVEQPSTLARVPVFLAALLVVRAVPTALYRPFAQRRRQLIAAGLMQATSLSIPVVAGAIGVGLGLMSKSNYAALVAAGLLSVLIFPLVALKLLPKPAADSPDRTGGVRRGQSASR